MMALRSALPPLAAAALGLLASTCATGYGDPTDGGDGAADDADGTAPQDDARGDDTRADGPDDGAVGDGEPEAVDGDAESDETWIPDGCVPSCTGRSCGDDGCGGSCGGCAVGSSCSDGSCIPDCVPSCAGRSCGDDGCGGSCGSCPDGTACDGSSCVATCVPRCAGRGCGDDGCGGSCGSCDAGQTCTASGMCVCDPAVEVVIYDQSAWNILADAFAADPSPCGHYYLSIPAVMDGAGEKTMPRAGETDTMHARGPRLHAMAEFHWASWSATGGMTWYEKGVEFRRRMVDAGYDVAANDTWAINELPSTTRTDPAVRDNVREAVRGLHDGPPGSPPATGAVFVIGMGHGTTFVSTYKTNVEAWIEDAAFWSAVNLHVAWWGQEVYTDPQYVCVGGVAVAERSSHINDFVEHFARLAAAGPVTANTAQSYLGRAYLPLMNAVLGASPGGGYGDTRLTVDQMKHHVSTQVYAARAWSGSHTYPDGRLGFAWARLTGITDTDLAEVAARLAASIHYAYDAGGGSAARACSPSGAYTWCACDVAGASFTEAWATFATW